MQRELLTRVKGNIYTSDDYDELYAVYELIIYICQNDKGKIVLCTYRLQMNLDIYDL